MGVSLSPTICPTPPLPPAAPTPHWWSCCQSPEEDGARGLISRNRVSDAQKAFLGAPVLLAIAAGWS